MQTEMYLGDAVYASFDGYQIKLRTSNGEHTTNEIVLEPGTLEIFDLFREQLKKPPHPAMAAPDG